MAFDDLTPSQREPLVALLEALATGDYYDEFAMSRRVMERQGNIHLYGKSGAKDRQLEGFTDSDTQVLIEEGYLSRLGLKATLKAKAYQQYKLLKGPSDLSENMPDSVDVHLRRLLKAYRAAGGSQSKGIVLSEVFKDENLSESDSWKEADYMEGESWIAVLADNGPPYVRLTHQGIKRAEAALDTEKGSEDEKRGAALSKTIEAISPMPNSTDSRNVFVVHGRNLEARNSLFRFLRSIGLRPLEWSQAVNKTGGGAPFIGNILDVAFSMAQAIVVLLTPDDEARLREPFRSPTDPPYEAQLTGQARPNVLFEAGMAMGRNPDRTIIVELGTLRPFSDIAGRHTIRLSNDSAARQELAQRLEAAGCAVDLSGRDWHTEGDFNLNYASQALRDSPRSPIAEEPLQNKTFTVFISYAHSDNESPDPAKRWLNRLLEYLQPLVIQGRVNAWSDTQIESGEQWDRSIKTQLQNANAAVLLVSPAFLSSKYIRNSELPALLMNAMNEGRIVLPIILRPCLFNETTFKYPDPTRGPNELSLSVFQSANPPRKPLNAMQEHEQDAVLLSVAQRILENAHRACFKTPIERS